MLPVCFEGSYVLTDLELSILLSTFISKSGDANSKIRIAVKGFYQSIVACADRSKARYSSHFHYLLDDAGPPALSQRAQRAHSTNHPHLLPRNDSLPGSQAGSPRKHHRDRARSPRFPAEITPRWTIAIRNARSTRASSAKKPCRKALFRPKICRHFPAACPPLPAIM